MPFKLELREKELGGVWCVWRIGTGLNMRIDPGMSPDNRHSQAGETAVKTMRTDRIVARSSVADRDPH